MSIQGKQIGNVLAPTNYDIEMLLAAGVHLGTKNVDSKMTSYVYKTSENGVNLLHLGRTWEKLMLAARIIVTVKNPKDVCAVSSRPFGQRGVLKFAKYTGAQSVTSRFTPGTFTNQIQPKFIEPRLVIATDPLYDYQAIREASYVNIPVIAFCNSDSNLQNVDVAIPCNNSSKQSVAIMYWLLTREVLRLRGEISRKLKWDVVPDLFLFRENVEIEKQQEEEDDEKKTLVVSSTENNGLLSAKDAEDLGEEGDDEDFEEEEEEEQPEAEIKTVSDQANAEKLKLQSGGSVDFFQ